MVCVILLLHSLGYIFNSDSMAPKNYSEHSCCFYPLFSWHCLLSSVCLLDRNTLVLPKRIAYAETKINFFVFYKNNLNPYLTKD